LGSDFISALEPENTLIFDKLQNINIYSFFL
jgi:hypothetical protein